MAAYVSLPGEPGTGVLLDALQDAGKRVILPVLLPDLDLDWGTYRGADRLRPAARAVRAGRRPARVRAIATADVVLVPGLAVSPTGMRLGRGGARPGARPGAGRDVHLRAALRRRGGDRGAGGAARPAGWAVATPSGVTPLG